jgi:hypothetical protein
VDAGARARGALHRGGVLSGILANEAQVVLAEAALPLADLDGAHGLLLQFDRLGGVVNEQPVLLGFDNLTILEVVPGVVAAHLRVHLDEFACPSCALGHSLIFVWNRFTGFYAADGARPNVN